MLDSFAGTGALAIRAMSRKNDYRLFTREKLGKSLTMVIRPCLPEKIPR